MASLIPNAAALERRLAGLPVAKHQAHEVVMAAGHRTGKLLFLINGAVEVIKDGEKIADVSARGSVFGEQAVLLDQPHTADVRTLEPSQFYVADASSMLSGDPSVALYIAAILARQLDGANRSLVEIKHQLQAGDSAGVIGKTVEKMEELIAYSGTTAWYTPAIRPIRLDPIGRCGEGRKVAIGPSRSTRTLQILGRYWPHSRHWADAVNGPLGSE